MKLCMVISSLRSGGAERVATTLANHWAKAGWQVSIVTMTNASTDFYGVDEAVKRVALGLNENSTSAFSGISNNLKRIVALRRTLRKEQPDIVLGLMPSCNILTGLACLGTSIISIGSEHNHPPMAPLSRPWSWLRRHLYPRLSAVTALTDDSGHWLTQHTGAKRVPVIPNPVTYPLPENGVERQPETAWGKLGGERRLLAVGRLTKQKGLDRLLDAFAVVRKSHPGWRLTILGEGPLREALESHRNRLGLEAFVAMPGAIGNIGAWYESADLYVMTSLFEGFGNTLAEALAYGLPAVAVDCETGPSSILRHEVDGVLVPQDDHHALVASLGRLMSSADERARLAARAVEARERFATSRVAGQWESLFAELIAEKRARLTTD
jgi:glycosyltransferase involved in cell wall biosynthesis